MADKKLTITDKKLLRRASSTVIETSLGELERYARNNSWLGRTNRYRQNTIERLDSDLNPNKKGIVNNSNLRQYIAASGPIHCLDGWGFLGRAMICHVQGDLDVSRHLAYYAELRAAMSLLAMQGIGIFSGRHMLVDATGTCIQFGRRLTTHKVAWLVLDHWSGLTRSMNVLSAAVSPYGIPFANWLDAFGAGTLLRPMASVWFTRWGLDLKYFSYDRDARNESSYRPTKIDTRDHISAIGISKFLAAFWRAYEPATSYQPVVLDRHLLRQGIESAFEALSGKKPVNAPVDFEFRAKKMIELLNPPGAPAEVLLDFLMRRSEPDTNVILEEASRITKLQDPRHHLQVMSRAVLLLRVATGTCGGLFQKAGYKRSDLEFWWQDLGKNLGFWDNSNLPDNLTDLWGDVEDVLSSLEQWISDHDHNNPSMFTFKSNKNSNLDVLSNCERIGLWGLGF